MLCFHFELSVQDFLTVPKIGPLALEADSSIFYNNSDYFWHVFMTVGLSSLFRQQ